MFRSEKGMFFNFAQPPGSMNSPLIYFLPAILALGGITSYEDIKEGKIKNKYTVAAVCLGITIHLLLFVFGIFNTNYTYRFFLFFLAAVILGILLWHWGFWSAGDAKLYLAFFSLIPLTTYKNNTANIPVFEILINTILPLFVYFTVKTLLRSSAAQKLAAVKKALNAKKLLVSLIAVFSLGWLSQLLFGYFSIDSNYIYNIIIIIVLFKALQKLFEEQTILLLALISLIRLFLQKDFIMRQSFVLSFFITLAGYIIIFSVITELGNCFRKTKKVGDLELGDKLSETDIIFFRKKGLIFSKTGLNREDLKNIRHCVKTSFIRQKEFDVYETIPFAPFLFMGCLATIISEGSFFILLKSLFH
jgi:prepilin signal peptidase PulO-like enzyme (type II secretory pathway)